ncbi:MucBP domain-containing protein [Furfurilactobacillus sp. WILCCON 0119]
MKSLKFFRDTVAILLFIITLGVTFPAFAAPDPNSFTIAYTWQNVDTNTAAFPSVSQHFAEGQPYFPLHVVKSGYTIDNNRSTFVDSTHMPIQTDTYAQFMSSYPRASSVDEVFAIYSHQGLTVQSQWLGTESFFNTVLIPNDETVTVNYVSSDGKQLDSKAIETKFSRTITIDQPSFDGYTIVANQPTSYKVDKDGAGANTVTVTYDPTASSGSESSSSSSSSSSSTLSTSSSSSISNDQSSSASQSNSQSSTSHSIVATLVKESSSNNSSSNAPAQQTSKHDTSQHASLPSTSAIGYTTSLIGVIILASITILFVFKKRNH